MKLTLLPADDIRDVIQHLFEIQSAVHGYLGPETQQELVRKMYVNEDSSCRGYLGGVPCSMGNGKSGRFKLYATRIALPRRQNQHSHDIQAPS